MKRSDIHSFEKINPEDYTFFDVVDTSLSVYEPKECLYYRSLFKHYRKETLSIHKSVHRCAHCGAHIRYAVIFTHVPSGTLTCFGEICADTLSMLDAKTYKQRRKEIVARAAHTREMKKAQQEEVEREIFLRKEFGDSFDALMLSENSFVHDVLNRFDHYHTISDKQIAALKDALRRDEENKKKYEQEQKELTEVPDGRLVITGTVLSAKYVTNKFDFSSPVLKALIKTDAGYKLWTSLPAKFNKNELYTGDYLDNIVNGKIKMTVRVQPSKDFGFGYGSRPSQMFIIEPAPRSN